MKRVWIYDDFANRRDVPRRISQGIVNWGNCLSDACKKIGLEPKMFENGSEFDGPGYLFMRLHNDPGVIDVDKSIYRVCDSTFVNGSERHHEFYRHVCIPQRNMVDCYDNKVKQLKEFRDFMPASLDIITYTDVHDWIELCGFPFIAKSADGSSSKNVHLIRSKIEALTIADIHIQNHRGLVFQEFLADNDCDYRVVRIGNEYFCFKRLIRSKEEPFASASGKIVAVDVETDKVARSAMMFGFDFLNERNIKFAAIDIARDHNRNRWRLLETSVSWTTKVLEHPLIHFWKRGRSGPPRRAKEMFDVIAEEIANGAFD